MFPWLFLCYVVTTAQICLGHQMNEYTSDGTEFVFAFSRNCDSSNIPELYVTIANTNEQPAMAQISSSYKPFKPITVTVDPHSIREVYFPTDMQVQYSHQWATENKGIRIISDQSITITAVNYLPHFSSMDGYLVIPFQRQRTTFFALTSLPYSGPYGGYPCQVVVIAAEDGTEVDFTLTDGTKKEAVLSSLQTFTYSNTSDLSGTRVKSNKPVAVVSGCTCTQLSYGSCDYEAEMMILVESYGSTFPIVAFANDSFGDFVRVLAAYDNTDISLNGEVEKTINQGQVYRFSIPSDFHGIVTTNKPVAVSHVGQQAWTYNYIGDPFVVSVPTDEAFIKGSCLFTTLLPYRYRGYTAYQEVNIITKNKAGTSITLDKAPIDKQWTKIGMSGFYFIKIPVSAGNHTITCTDPTAQFTATIYGYSFAVGYGYVCRMSMRADQTTTTTKTSTTPTTITTATTMAVTTTETAGFSCFGKPNGLYPDPDHPCATYYFSCFDNEKYIYHCPNGTFYNPQKLSCLPQSEVPACIFSCIGKQNGVYSDPAHPCAQYCFFCYYSQRFTIQCPSRKYFDKHLRICLPKCEVPACIDSSCH